MNRQVLTGEERVQILKMEQYKAERKRKLNAGKGKGKIESGEWRMENRNWKIENRNGKTEKAAVFSFSGPPGPNKNLKQCLDPNPWKI